MDDIRFTKHTTLIDYRAVFKSVPSIYSFRPRENPQRTLAVLTDVSLDLARKDKPIGTLCMAGDFVCKGNHAMGRLRALGHTSNEVTAILGRLRDIIVNDKTGVADVIFSSRFSPYENLGWFMDKSPENNPYIVAISYHRVIINGKQHSLEYYRDNYLPYILRKRVLRKTGRFNPSVLRTMRPRHLIGSVDDVAEYLVRHHEAACGSLA